MYIAWNGSWSVRLKDSVLLIVLSIRSRKTPTTSPTCHCLPNVSAVPEYTFSSFKTKFHQFQILSFAKPYRETVMRLIVIFINRGIQDQTLIKRSPFFLTFFDVRLREQTREHTWYVFICARDYEIFRFERGQREIRWFTSTLIDDIIKYRWDNSSSRLIERKKKKTSSHTSSNEIPH